jgi:hypothetical protein
MNGDDFEDVEIICRDCQTIFAWTHSEREWYRDRNLRQPKRCKGCRAARKAERDMR